MMRLDYSSCFCGVTGTFGVCAGGYLETRSAFHFYLFSMLVIKNVWYNHSVTWRLPWYAVLHVSLSCLPPICSLFGWEVKKKRHRGHIYSESYFLFFPGWMRCFFRKVWIIVQGDVFFHLVGVSELVPNRQRCERKPRCIIKAAHMMDPANVLFRRVHCSLVDGKSEDDSWHVGCKCYCKVVVFF